MKKMTEVIKKELSEHSADIFSEAPKRHQKKMETLNFSNLG